MASPGDVETSLREENAPNQKVEAGFRESETSLAASACAGEEGRAEKGGR